MSTTIDERVVEMRFDNRQFESATQESLSTLEKLKRSLNLTGASKGLEEVNSAAKRFDLSGIGNAVDVVNTKFSALQVAGITALANITNSAVNYGKRIVSEFTIDPIKSGLSEYETQINSVQTILANTESKGTTLKDVNNALDTLNTYADKTIYNFTEMTRNIGTFTAAGVDLDTSVNAIQGIANLAAVSGSNSQQASTAMYQLSQALASGTVKLMDWNSVVNAGMGGQVFQDALKETARVHGIAIDDMIKENGSFRETLQEGWLSSEILTETLQKFTMTTEGLTDAEIERNRELLKSKGYTDEQIEGIFKLGNTATNAATKVKTFTQLMDTLKESAQSGWTQTWEILIGDFEEAKELWTKVSEVFGGVIGASAKARNDLLQGWADKGGREKAIEGFKSGFEGIVNIIKPIKEAFREIFPPATSEQLIKFTDCFRNLTKSFADFTSSHGDQIKSTFKGIFSLIDIGVTFVKELAGGAIELIGCFKGLGGGVLDATGSFGDWASKLRDTVKETGIFKTAVGGIVTFLKKAIEVTKEFGGFLKEKLVMPGFEGFLSLMQGIWDIIKKIGNKVSEVGSSIGDALANAFQSGDISSGLDVINGGILAAILLNVKKFIGDLTDAFDGAGFLESVKDILDGVKGSLEAWQQNLKANTLLKLAGAIGILSVALLILATIDPAKLTASLGAITVLFGDLVGSMALLGKVGDITGVVKIVTAMIGISVSVLILATALKKIGSLSLTELAKGLVGIFGLTAIIVGAAKVMSSESKYIIKGAGQMILMAVALKILASSCKDLSTLSWEGLAKGVSGVVIMMYTLAKITDSLKGGKGLISAGVGMIAIAAGIKILASACKDFSTLSWEELAKGLSASVIMIFMLTKSASTLSNSKGLISAGIGIVILAAGIKVLASAVTDMSKMSWTEIAKGLSTLAVSLFLITSTMSNMPKNMIGAGVGLVIVSSALIILSEALGRMGGMSWMEIAKGLSTLAVSLFVLQASLTAMTGTLGGSAALLVAAVALNIFIPVLEKLGNMSVPEIIKSLVTLAGAFAILGVAGYVLTPLVPTILSLSASIALFGVSCLAIGVGIGLIAAGITALAVAVSGGATAIVAGLTVIITGLIGLIPVIVQRIGEALIVLCEVIAKAAPALGEAVKALVLMLVDVLVECVPAIADGALKLISGVLSALVEYTPQIVGSIFDFFIGLLDKFAEKLPTLIQSAVNLLMAFLTGIVDALKGLDTTSLIEGVIAIGILAGLMTLLASVAALVPGAMIGVLGLGAVIAEMAIVLAAIGALAQLPGLKWLIGEGGQLLQTIGTAIGQFMGGIVGGLIGGVTSQFPQIGSDLSGFMTNAEGFIDGAKNIDPAMMNGVKALADTILLLTAANILDGIANFVTGGSSLSSFGEELGGLGTSLNTFVSNLGSFDESKVTIVTCAANAIKSLAQAASELPNEGGWAAAILGDNTISDFGDKLPELGTNLRAFATNLGTFDESKVTTVTCAANAINAMAQAADALPNEGGWAAAILGDNSISDFASKLPELGTNLCSFATNLGTFDNAKVATVTCAASAIKAMADAASGIDGQAGWAKKIFGDNSLSSFGAEMAGLGTNLKTFSTNLGTFNESKVATVNCAVKAVKALAGLADADLKGATKNIGGFGEKLGGFASNISTFCSNMPETSKVTTATNNVEKILTTIKSISNTEGDIGKFSDSLKSIGKEGVDAFVKAFTSSSAKTNIKNAGIELITKTIEGIKSKIPAFKTTCSDVAKQGVVTIRGQYSSFVAAGNYLGSGLVAGINSMMTAVYNAAYKLGQKAAQGAKDGEDAHSPSREGIKAGEWLGEGLVIGIANMGRKVYNAGHEMGEEAVRSLSKAMVGVNDLINGDMDTQPTIRPVLDLSDVKSGIGSINGMFNTRHTLGVLSNVDAISSIVNGRQNGSNDDVVSAINKLRGELGNVGNTTYNVNGITYDDGSNISNAVQSLVRAARMERRV